MSNALLRFAALALLPAAAFAQDAAPPAAAPAAPPASSSITATPPAPETPAAKKLARNDPNRMVCENVEELGSRISSKRVCMTNAEWKQQRMEMRSAVDRTQNGRGCNTAGVC